MMTPRCVPVGSPNLAFLVHDAHKAVGSPKRRERQGVKFKSKSEHANLHATII